MTSVSGGRRCECRTRPARALVDECGWSLVEYCDWLVDSFDRLLLR